MTPSRQTFPRHLPYQQCRGADLWPRILQGPNDAGTWAMRNTSSHSQVRSPAGLARLARQLGTGTLRRSIAHEFNGSSLSTSVVCGYIPPRVAGSPSQAGNRVMVFLARIQRRAGSQSTSRAPRQRSWQDVQGNEHEHRACTIPLPVAASEQR